MGEGPSRTTMGDAQSWMTMGEGPSRMTMGKGPTMTTGEGTTISAPMTPIAMTNGGCGGSVCPVGGGGDCGGGGLATEIDVSPSIAGGGGVVGGGSDRCYGAFSKKGSVSDVGRNSSSPSLWGWSSLMGALSTPSKV